MGVAAVLAGDAARGRQHFAQALAGFEGCGAERWAGFVMLNQGATALRVGVLGEALERHEAAIEALAATYERRMVGVAHVSLAGVFDARQDAGAAAEHRAIAASIFRQLGARNFLALLPDQTP